MATMKEETILPSGDPDITPDETDALAENDKDCAPLAKRRKTSDAAQQDVPDNGTIKNEITENDDNMSPEKKRKSKVNGNGAGTPTVKEEVFEDLQQNKEEAEKGCDESNSSWNELPKDISDDPEKTTIKAEDVPEFDVKPEDDQLELDCDRITSFKSLGPHLARQENHLNYDYIADIPQICKDEPCMLGIDEAGRGPVLGPMVYGIAFCPLSKADNLKTLGCADSKQLTEPERERIFNDLLTKEYASTTVGWAVDVISPNYISNKMLSRVKVSLNEISMNSAIALVNKAIDAGVNIAEVYVDTVGPPEKYQAKLSALFPDFQITVAKKADSTYPIVSAASICAKVARDQSLKYWIFPEGLTDTYESFGSGYPGDPKTKAFLENNVDKVFGFPRIVRFSWSTAVNVLDRKAYRMDFPDAEEERDLKYKAASSITKFMKPKAPVDGENDLSWYVPCRFFRERCMEHCENI